MRSESAISENIAEIRVRRSLSLPDELQDFWYVFILHQTQPLTPSIL
jgi:hypothetical protein